MQAEVIKCALVKVDLGIWSKLTRLVMFLLCLSGCVAIGLWYLPVIQKNERLRKQKLYVETLIEKEEQDGRQLKMSIDSLHNPKAMERLVRERLGYAKPGEVVVRFDSSTNTYSR
jgi:cell division protein FtsB